VHDYLKFEKWSKGLQRELDTSWAILGEVYGRFTREALNKLQLNIRRIRTNIENKTTLQSRVPFVPDAIRFSVAEPELLKLLIAPLYGDDPLYGIRELTQNATDSVREMEHLISIGNIENVERLIGLADVELRITTNPTPLVVISDRGTGMTLDVIKNFFLRAGASFRNSDLWRQQFEDSTGASKIARTGRFGVGALSAFLIGEKMEVYTRHLADKSGFGLKFFAAIDDDEIEITRERGPVGTKISIFSDKARIQKIADYFQKPRSVPFYFEPTDTNMSITVDKSTIVEPKYGEQFAALKRKPSWVSVSGTKYDKVQWDRTSRAYKVSWGFQYVSGYVFCNGILIGDLKNPATNLIARGPRWAIGDVWKAVAPTVSISDNNGILPLDLSRKTFAKDDTELSESILRSMWVEFVASVVYSDCSSPGEFGQLWSSGDFRFTSSFGLPIIFCKNGWAFLDESRFVALAQGKVIILPVNHKILDQVLRDPLIDDQTIVLMKSSYFTQSRRDIIYAVRELGRESLLPGFGRRDGIVHQSIVNAYAVFDKKTFENALGLYKAPKYLKAMLREGYTFNVGDRTKIIVDRN
jgi:hypothetical protein